MRANREREKKAREEEAEKAADDEFNPMLAGIEQERERRSKLVCTACNNDSCDPSQECWEHKVCRNCWLLKQELVPTQPEGKRAPTKLSQEEYRCRLCKRLEVEAWKDAKQRLCTDCDEYLQKLSPPSPFDASEQSGEEDKCRKEKKCKWNAGKCTICNQHGGCCKCQEEVVVTCEDCKKPLEVDEEDTCLRCMDKQCVRWQEQEDDLKNDTFRVRRSFLDTFVHQTPETPKGILGKTMHELYGIDSPRRDDDDDDDVMLADLPKLAAQKAGGSNEVKNVDNDDDEDGLYADLPALKTRNEMNDEADKEDEVFADLPGLQTRKEMVKEAAAKEEEDGIPSLIKRSNTADTASLTTMTASTRTATGGSSALHAAKKLLAMKARGTPVGGGIYKTTLAGEEFYYTAETQGKGSLHMHAETNNEEKEEDEVTTIDGEGEKEEESGAAANGKEAGDAPGHGSAAAVNGGEVHHYDSHGYDSDGYDSDGYHYNGHHRDPTRPPKGDET